MCAIDCLGIVDVGVGGGSCQLVFKGGLIEFIYQELVQVTYNDI